MHDNVYYIVLLITPTNLKQAAIKFWCCWSKLFCRKRQIKLLWNDSIQKYDTVVRQRNWACLTKIFNYANFRPRSIHKYCTMNRSRMHANPGVPELRTSQISHLLLVLYPSLWLLVLGLSSHFFTIASFYNQLLRSALVKNWKWLLDFISFENPESSNVEYLSLNIWQSLSIIITFVPNF